MPGRLPCIPQPLVHRIQHLAPQEPQDLLVREDPVDELAVLAVALDQGIVEGAVADVAEVAAVVGQGGLADLLVADEALGDSVRPRL